MEEKRMVSIVIDNSVREGAMDLVGAMRRSRPVIAHIRTSVIKQDALRRRFDFRKSSMDSKASAAKPASQPVSSFEMV